MAWTRKNSASLRKTADVQRRIEETVADLTREQTLISDANAAHERLSGEQERIEAAREGEEEARSQAASDLESANDAVGAHEGTISTLTQQVAETEAKRGSLERREQEVDNRHQRLGTRLSELREEHGRLSADAPEADALHDAERDIASRQVTAETAEAENQAAEAARLAAQGKLEEARQVMNGRTRRRDQTRSRERRIIEASRHRRSGHVPTID